MNSYNCAAACVGRRGQRSRLTAATTFVIVVLLAYLTQAVGQHVPTVINPESSYKANNVNLDVVLLFDTTYSFANQLRTMQKTTGNFFDRLKKLYPNVRLGIAGFRDKPYEPFGETTDYCFKRFIDLTNDHKQFMANNMAQYLVATGGQDVPENPLEAIMAVFARKAFNWREPPETESADNYRKVLVILTDTDYHVYGDVTKLVKARKFKTSHGKIISKSVDAEGSTSSTAPFSFKLPLRPTDGTKNGCETMEYPKKEQVARLLKENHVEPIFAAQESRKKKYTDLVQDLKQGYVATINLSVGDYYNQILGTIYKVVQPHPAAASEEEKTVYVPHVEDVKVNKIENAAVTPIHHISVESVDEKKAAEEREAQEAEKARVEEPTVVEPEPGESLETKELPRPEEEEPEKVTSEEERPVPVDVSEKEVPEIEPPEKEETPYMPEGEKEKPSTVVIPEEEPEKGKSKEVLPIISTTSTKRMIPVPVPIPVPLPPSKPTKTEIAKKSKSNKYKYLIPAGLVAGVGAASALGYGIKHWMEGKKQQPDIINPPTAVTPISPPFTPPEEPVPPISPPFTPPEEPVPPVVPPFVPPVAPIETPEESEVPVVIPEQSEILPMPTEIPFIRPIEPPVGPVIPPVPPVGPPIIPPVGPPVVPPAPEPTPHDGGEGKPSEEKGSSTVMITSAAAGAVALIGVGSYLAYRYRQREPIEGIEGHFDDEEVEGLTEEEKREAVAATDVSAYA